MHAQCFHTSPLRNFYRNLTVDDGSYHIGINDDDDDVDDDDVDDGGQHDDAADDDDASMRQGLILGLNC